MVQIVLKATSIVSAETRPDHEKMRGHQHIDEVELQYGNCRHRSAKMSNVGSHCWARTIKALGGERNTPAFGRADSNSYTHSQLGLADNCIGLNFYQHARTNQATDFHH